VTGVYAIAAVVVDSADHDDIRTALECLRVGKSPRLHWREESPAQQLAIADAIARMPVGSFVTVHIFSRGLPYTRQREGRAPDSIGSPGLTSNTHRGCGTAQYASLKVSMHAH
jgi:hypothetical protein